MPVNKLLLCAYLKSSTIENWSLKLVYNYAGLDYSTGSSDIVPAFKKMKKLGNIPIKRRTVTRNGCNMDCISS